MKQILALVLIVPFAFGQEILQHFDLDKQNHYLGTTTYEFSIDQESGAWTLDIRDIKGDVYLSGEPGNIVQITEEVSIWSISGFRAKALFDEYRARVNQSVEGHVITVEGSGNWPSRSSFDYSISLPTNFNVSLQTAGGDVNAERITGEVNLSTQGGDIDGEYITGKCVLRTAGGDVEAEHCEGSVALVTSGGDIDVNQIAGEVEANTSGGSIYVESVQGDVIVQTSGGELSFEDIVGRRIKGITSGGSIEATRIQADMDVQTNGGDIEIDDLAGHLEASTSGGDIEIDEIRGNADLSTSGGDIYAGGLRGSLRAKTNAGTMEVEKIWDASLPEHDIYIINNYGSIDLLLPDNFPAHIDAAVENEISSTVIDSDFPLEISQKEDEVRAETIIGDGTYSVKLRTSHGSISIERGND